MGDVISFFFNAYHCFVVDVFDGGSCRGVVGGVLSVWLLVFLFVVCFGLCARARCVCVCFSWDFGACFIEQRTRYY